MIFIKCINEKLVQVDDKTRIDVSKSFINAGVVSEVEIKPEASENFYSVYNTDQKRWYLDWAYETDGAKVITVRITTDLSVKTVAFNIDIITAVDDYLYSDDSDIFSIESELKNYIPRGRNSFLNKHRAAQEHILSYLDRKNIKNQDGTKILKGQIIDINDVRDWSKYETLKLVYEDLVVSVGDIFKDKANMYRDLALDHATRSLLRLDFDKDTVQEQFESLDMRTFRMTKR